MKITIEAEPKEIAALVLALQERREYPALPIAEWVEKTMSENPNLFTREV